MRRRAPTLSRILTLSHIPILVATLAACGGDPGLTDDLGVQIRDSAGVRIVEYAGEPAGEAPFALAAEPRYRQGANPGDYEFQFVDAGRIMPDGGAVVAWYSGMVALSPDGTTHEVLATAGEGPGEVISPHAVFVHTRSDRPEVTWYLPDGTVTQIVRWRPEPNLLAEELLEHGEAYIRMLYRRNRVGKRARPTPSFSPTASGWDRSRPHPASESST